MRNCGQAFLEKLLGIFKGFVRAFGVSQKRFTGSKMGSQASPTTHYAKQSARYCSTPKHGTFCKNAELSRSRLALRITTYANTGVRRLGKASSWTKQEEPEQLVTLLHGVSIRTLVHICHSATPNLYSN